MHIDQLRLMQIHDSAFPIGGYTHSFGMETYIQKDTVSDQASLFSLCKAYALENVKYGDGLFVSEVMRAWKEAPWQMQEVAEIGHAIKVAKETREASLMMGRQFLKTIRAIEGEALFQQVSQWLECYDMPSHHSFVYALFAAHENIGRTEAVTTFIYSSVTSLVHNAVRAVPLGQSTGMETIRNLLPLIQTAGKDIENLTIYDARNGTVGLELASMEHEHLNVRLFIS